MNDTFKIDTLGPARIKSPINLGTEKGDLLADFVSSGKASATLEVTITSLGLVKSFTDDPVHGGGSATLEFTITETGDRKVAKHRPIVVITSNAEKELPDPFLRRCIFHFIEFPDRELMKQIVDVHHPNIGERLLDQVLGRGGGGSR